MFNKYAAVAAVAGSTLVGGALGVAVFAPHLAGAQSSPTPATSLSSSPPTASASGSNTFHSNEDPAHEATESPEREAEEDSERAFRGGHGGSNEDPAHEASESPEREAQEDAGANGNQSAPPAASAGAAAPAS